MENKQTNIEQQDWLQQEANKINENKFDGEELPALTLEENKITTITVNFVEPFGEWRDNSDPEKIIIKKIIKIEHEGVKKNFWLNVKNPLYSELVNRGLTGETTFKIIRTGTQQDTRYNIVE